MIRWARTRHRYLSAALICAAFVLCTPTASYAQCTNPAGQTGEIIYNSSEGLYQGCKTDNNWQALHAASGGGDGSSDPCDPSNSPSAGQTCDDGSIYAGLSPDGDVAMYTTPADASSLMSWNDGSSNWVDTAIVNCTDNAPGTASSCQTGQENTALLADLNGSGSPAPYEAAEYCNTLTAHEQSDWYLPAQDELDVLCNNRSSIGGFDTSGSYPASFYMSSSEENSADIRWQVFDTCAANTTNILKSIDISVRCVRSGYPSACANPTGRTGEIIYNSSEGVFQGCTDSGWQAMHEAGSGGGGCSNPTGKTGEIIYNTSEDAFQGCTADGWMAFHEIMDPCTGTTSDPAIGETCTDGSIYAGLSPDGNVAMYTTPADAASTYTWNDGTTNYTDMSMANCTDTSPGTAATCQTGEANTAFLVGATGEPDYPFAAAEYCDGLTAHGYSDWYLPAQDELNVLYTNKNTGDLNGTFDKSGSFPAGWYWSSSESISNGARSQSFSDGGQTNGRKHFGVAVRCVRR